MYTDLNGKVDVTIRMSQEWGQFKADLLNLKKKMQKKHYALTQLKQSYNELERENVSMEQKMKVCYSWLTCCYAISICNRYIYIYT